MEGSNVVYIGNLAWNTNSEQLLQCLTSAVAGVVSAKVQRHEDTKRSKGWGLAEFDSHTAALNAIANLDKTLYNGRLLHLRLDRAVMEVDTTQGPGVFVGNVQWAVTKQELMELFASYNPQSCRILTNMYGRSKGFAIITFASDAEASNAIAAMNGVEFRQRVLECRFDRGAGKPDDAPGDRGSVFVNKLGPDVMDDDALAVVFSHLGVVVSAKLQKAPTGRSKGWGIVTFQNVEQARAAVAAMNGFLLPGAAAPLEARLDRRGRA